MQRVGPAINRYQILLLINSGDIIVICVIVKVACQRIAFASHVMMLLVVAGVFGLYVNFHVEIFYLVYLDRVSFNVP